MVTQPEAREAIARAVSGDSRMPSDLDVLLQEPDGDGRDAQKTLPLLIVQFEETARPDRKTTDVVGYKQNEDGDNVARIFEKEWSAQARIELWTADGSRYDVDNLGRTLTSVLYGYDTTTTNDPFLDDNGEEIEELWHFSLNEGFRADNLTQTPTVRRWRQFADVYGCELYVEDEQPTITSAEPNVFNDETSTIQ